MREFLPYLICMALVTYLVRMVPFVLIRKKIKNRYLLSFLSYMPYAVMSAMTVPAVFYATGNIASAIVGFAFALLLTLLNRSLTVVAFGSCAAVVAAEYIIRYIA